VCPNRVIWGLFGTVPKKKVCPLIVYTVNWYASQPSLPGFLFSAMSRRSVAKAVGEL
jgi:hypothetical protein